MQTDLKINHNLTIPFAEIQVMVSRAGGPGGQHVNKTNSRITLRWNLLNSISLTPEQKQYLAQKLASRLTSEGDLIVHNSTSRSQQQNKIAAFVQFVKLIRQALYVPKKRMKTRVPKSAQEQRLNSKSRHANIKKLRSNKFSD